jgi:serine/threonine protein kinase/nucleoside phosphorylase
VSEIDKKNLSERDICTKYITPAILKAGWNLETDIREEVSFTDGRVIAQGKHHTRGPQKLADYILSYQNIRLAIVEAKKNELSLGYGMQQAVQYAEILQVPFVFTSNGDGFMFRDLTSTMGPLERELSLDQFPTPETLLRRYQERLELTEEGLALVTQDYYTDAFGKELRYYQVNAISRALEAIAKGQNRLLLVMATGTGKTYTAFQIIWRLWKAGVKKRILFLADRNVLIDQAKDTFKPFGQAMTKISKRKIDKSFEIYLSLYQAITGSEEDNIYKEFSPDFFDLVVIDECHRGRAWRGILDYFSSATHVGLTATPKETKDVSTMSDFGEPVYTYSLRDGINDGFLTLDQDLGWRPTKGQTEKLGQEIEDRIYNLSDMDPAPVASPPWDATQRPDVAILIALPEEFRSLAAEYSKQWHPRRNLEYPGSDFLFVGPGGYRCVATIMPRMGPMMASQTSMRLLAWRPAVIINVGIAGGFKDDLRIGDVIVPRQVDAYDETAKIKGVRWERRGSDYRPSVDLLAEVQELEFTSHEAHARWVDAGAAQLAQLRAGPHGAAVDKLLNRKLLRDKPTTSIYHLASGSFVVASKPFAEFIREANADIHAGEMEAAGMMAATEYQRRSVSTLVVRGISDHVDADKTEIDDIGDGALRWLAMANAWRLVSTLMELGVLPRNPENSAETASSLAGRQIGNVGVDAGVGSNAPKHLSLLIDEARLTNLREQREQIILTQGNTRALDAEILHLRRQIRESPNLDVDDILLDRYRLVEKIGKGGFATVWKALDRKTQQFVAVKALHVQWAEDRSRVERFRTGAEKVKLLHHGAIVPIIDGAHQENHHHFFVMPWFSGSDLRRAVEAGMDSKAVIGAAAQAIEGLAFAHSRGLVHRDVKPDNILLDEQSKGWISDFDLVRDEHSTAGTRTHAGMGSFGYAAPELLNNAKDADARADVYGAGMVLLFALLRQDPPALIAKTEPQLIAKLPCGERLREAIRGAVAYERERRTTTCEGLSAAARAFHDRELERVSVSNGGSGLRDSEGGILLEKRGAWISAAEIAARFADLDTGRVKQISDVLGLSESQIHYREEFRGDRYVALYSSSAFGLICRDLRSRGYYESLDGGGSRLNIDWSSYYRLIRRGNGSPPSKGVEIRLQELEKCQELFRRYSGFHNMPLEARQFMADFGTASGCFGMAAGTFKSMIIQRPQDVGSILDAIPMEGQPEDADVIEFVDRAVGIFGVGLASATRLLIAKRPDLFLCVNRPSRERIEQFLGGVPKGAAAYLRLLKQIWSMRWYREPEPDNERERRVWRARVAILDAVMFDARSR